MRTWPAVLVGIVAPLLAVVALAMAQETPVPEASPSPHVMASPEPDVASIVTVDGKLQAVVPAQDGAPAATVVTVPGGEAVVSAPVVVPEAKKEEAVAIAANSAEDQKAVASGDEPVSKATRSLRDVIDLGSQPALFLVLAMIFGAVVRPPLNAWVKAHPKIDDDSAGAIHVGSFLIVYTAAWAAFHGSHPDLPQDWEGWMVMGAGSAMAGTVANRFAGKLGGIFKPKADTP